MSLMEPDAYWDIILTSFILNRKRTSQKHQLLLFFVWETVKINIETKIREQRLNCVKV